MGFVYQNCLVCSKHKTHPESTTKSSQIHNFKSEFINDDEDESKYNNEEENSPDASRILKFFCKQFKLSSKEKSQLIDLDIESPFCGKCVERLNRLDELQEQFLLIQREMYALQACLSLAVLTENGNDTNVEDEDDEEKEDDSNSDDDDDRPLVATLIRLKNKKSSNFIKTIKNNIRQRFKPKVVLTRKTDTKIRKILPSTQSTNTNTRQQSNSTKVSSFRSPAPPQKQKEQVNNTNEDYNSDCEYNDPLYFDDHDDEPLNYEDNDNDRNKTQSHSNSHNSNKNHKQTVTKDKNVGKKQLPPRSSSSSTTRKSTTDRNKPSSQPQSTLPVKKSSRLLEKEAAAANIEIIEIDDTAESLKQDEKVINLGKQNKKGEANREYWDRRLLQKKASTKKKYKKMQLRIPPAMLRKKREERARRIQEKREAEANVEYDMSWVEDKDDDEHDEENVDEDSYDDDFNPDLYNGVGELRTLPYKSNRPISFSRETETPGIYQQGDSPWRFQQISGVGWKCLADGCNFTRLQRFKILNHIHQVHDTTRPRCEICNVAYSDLIALRQHICKGPPRTRPQLTVEISEGRFSFKGYEFEKVDRYQHEGKDYKCSVAGCGFLTRKKTQMSSHISYSHAQTNSLMCHLCAKSYPTQSMLEKHLITHDPDAVPEYFYCDQCPVKRKTRSSLMSHVRVHHEGYRYKCGSCDCHYQTPGCLSRHLKTTGHQKIKETHFDDLNCELCNSKQFANEKTFNKHLQNCKGRTKYSCDICLANGTPKDFVMFRSLQKHAKLEHNQDLVRPSLGKKRKPVDMSVTIDVSQEKIAREISVQDPNINGHTGQGQEQHQSQEMDTTTMMTTTTTTVPNFTHVDTFTGASSSSISTTQSCEQPSVIDYPNPYMNFHTGYFPQ